MSFLNSLAKFVENGSNLNGTDKTTSHSYGELYDKLLSPYKDLYRNIVEIGVLSGGSCAAFSDFFHNAKVYGIDISFDHLKHGKENEKIKYILTDGTSPECLHKLNLNEIDLVLDDGSHDPYHQVHTARLFVPLISKNGLFICEDINSKNIDFIRKEFQNIANENNMKLDWYDLRNIKNRFDDIVAVIHH
jgi:cephalosporin hydroxylase